MTGVTGIGFAPLVAWQAVALIAAVAFALLIFAVIRGARGSIIRAVAIAILAAALLNPHLESETRRGEPDIALVLRAGQQHMDGRLGECCDGFLVLRLALTLSRGSKLGDVVHLAVGDEDRAGEAALGKIGQCAVEFIEQQRAVLGFFALNDA